MLFFAKRRAQKERELKDKLALNSFATVVTSIVSGIHNLDKLMQKMMNAGDISYDSALVVYRSCEDLFALLDIYRNNKYYHHCFDYLLEKGIESIKRSSSRLKDLTENSRIMYENYKLTRNGLDTYKDQTEIDVDRETLEDIHQRLMTMMMEHHQVVFEIRLTQIELRSVMNAVRGIVVRDYITIKSGINIPLLYEDYETLVNNHLKQEILFDKVEIQKISANKGGKEHE